MRRLALALVSVMSFSVAACGGTKDAQPQATSMTCPPATVAAAPETKVDGGAPIATVTPIATVKTPEPKQTVAAKSDVTAKKLGTYRVVLARDVKNREPIDAGTRFDSTEPKVFAFIEVENKEKAPGTLYVEWVSPKKTARGDIELSVGPYDHWRTWAFTRLAKEPGTWKVRVKNDRGEVVAEQSFEVFSVD